MRGQLIAFGVAVALLVVGCGSPAPAPAGAERPDGVPRDRDDRAVMAALSRLDPCALLAAGAVATGPHRCVLTTPGEDELVVRVGVPMVSSVKYHHRLLTLHGAKAYGSGFDAACAVRIPVSFTRVIEFSARTGPHSTTNACTWVNTVASAAVTTLAHPLRGTDSDPFRYWDACVVLRAAMAGDAENYYLHNDSNNRGIDFCGAGHRQAPPKTPATLTLDFAYGPDPGGSVRVEDGNGCTLTRSVRPDRVVTLLAPDCALGERLMGWIMIALTSNAHNDIEPQWPLLYRPDEPDLPVRGACVHHLGTAGVGGSDDCRPYVETAVPTRGVELVRAAATDPNLICAFAAASIAKHLEPPLTPVVTHNACVFVEQTHAVHLEITVEPDGTLGRVDADGYYQQRRNLTVAGHPGLYLNVYDLSHHMYVETGGGLMHLELTLSTLSANHTPTQLEPALAEIITAHL